MLTNKYTAHRVPTAPPPTTTLSYLPNGNKMGIGKHVSDVHVMSSLEQVERISVLQFRFFFKRGTPEIK